MTAPRRFITKHPAAVYFAVTFALSWGGVLLVIGGPGGIPGTAAQTNPLFPFVYLAMLVGPSVAGILLTAVVHGRSGLRDFASRLLTWRVDVRWYAIALLTAPVLVTLTVFALSFFSDVYRLGIIVANDKASRLLFGAAVGLGAGFFEELGWTGFAVPELRRRHGILSAGLILGAVWGVWHMLVVAWGIGDALGSVPLALFLPLDLLSVLPAYRVLMIWVWDRTGSLLLAMLMHASLTASMLILDPPAVAGASLLIYEGALAGAMWLVILGVRRAAPRTGRAARTARWDQNVPATRRSASPSYSRSPR